MARAEKLPFEKQKMSISIHYGLSWLCRAPPARDYGSAVIHRYSQEVLITIVTPALEVLPKYIFMNWRLMYLGVSVKGQKHISDYN